MEHIHDGCFDLYSNLIQFVIEKFDFSVDV